MRGRRGDGTSRLLLPVVGVSNLSRAPLSLPAPHWISGSFHRRFLEGTAGIFLTRRPGDMPLTRTRKRVSVTSRVLHFSSSFSSFIFFYKFFF